MRSVRLLVSSAVGALAAGLIALSLAAPAKATMVQIDPGYNGFVCLSGCNASPDPPTATLQAAILAALAADAVLANHSYTETTVSLSATTWQTAIAADSTRHGLIISDPAGIGCKWSVAASPSASQGTYFSLAGAAGSYDFNKTAPTNLVKVRCDGAATITVEAF